MRTPRIIPPQSRFFPFATHCYVNADDVGRNFLVEVVDNFSILEPVEGVHSTHMTMRALTK